MTTETLQIAKSFKPSVSSHGYADANIMFLTGHPLTEDLTNGLAISGYAESTLNSFLRPHKLTLAQCYRSCFIKEKLTYSGMNPKKLGNALKLINIEEYLNLLFEEIKYVNPNIIVPLDDIALGAVYTHINAIKKPNKRKYFIYCYRGSVLPLRDDFQVKLPFPIRVIPTLGPQLLNVDYTARSFVAVDFRRISDNRNSRLPVKDPGLVWIARNANECRNFFTRGLERNDGYVTFDIETYGGFITCISFCFDGNEACSIPLSPFFYQEISSGELALIWLAVAKLLSNKVAKCNQNIKYDWTILERHGFNVVNVVHDTMLKAGLIYPELPKPLDFLTSLYTDIPYYKDEGKEFDPRAHSKDRLLLYNAKDSLAAHIVNKEQDKELIELDQKELYFNEIAPLILIYKDLDETGIPVDLAIKERLLFKYTNMFESNLAILRGLVGNEKFNPRSSKQVGELLYEELGFPKRTKTDENGIKRYKTDKETLDELLINHGENNKKGQLGYHIISRVTVTRKIAKVIEYIETPLHPDSTFRASSNLAGTETGRSSSSKTIDEILLTDEEIKQRGSTKRTLRLGRSLQTITKHGFQLDDEVFDDFDDTEIASDLRSMFVPPSGYTFVEGDGSQAEARAVAVLAEDYELLDSFDRKPKIHAKTAAAIFGIDVNTITKDFPTVPKIGIAYYDLGKRIRHAGNYAMTEFRLAQMTHIPIIKCKEMLRIFHETNPKIQSVFHKGIDDAIRQFRELETPFGRKRRFYDRLSEHVFKEAKAQIPQSTISDQTKFTMRRVIENCSGYMKDYKFATEQHDGILAIVRTARVNEYSEVFKQQYERSISFRRGSLIRNFDLTIPCELSKSNVSWMDLEEFKIC